MLKNYGGRRIKSKLLRQETEDHHGVGAAGFGLGRNDEMTKAEFFVGMTGVGEGRARSSLGTGSTIYQWNALP
jgi:hypothetical protein